MPRRKAKDKPEAKGFEQVQPLDPSYGAFQVPSYPYGAKSQKQAETPEEKPITLNGIPIEFIPPWPQSEESKEAEPSTEPEAGSQDTTTPKQEAEAATDHANKAGHTNEPGDKGDTPISSYAAVAADSPQLACNLKRDVFNRLMREGRWWGIAPIRDRMVKEAKASGMEKEAAQVWAYTEINRLYPPLPPKADKPPPGPSISPEKPTSEPPADQVPGLYVIPENWPPLPDNASLQQELGWVQSQRLAVVEERGNATIVRLERASSPAPSKAALGWLETSIRSYAKYIEVAAKTLAGAADEAESVRRERMRLDEIRALLDEMHRDQV